MPVWAWLQPTFLLGVGTCKAGLGCHTWWHQKEPEWVQASWVRSQHPLASTGLSTNQTRLEYSTPWQIQDPGLGVGLVGELWAFPCWAAAPSSEHGSQDMGQTRVVNVAAPVSIHVEQVWGWVRPH